MMMAMISENDDHDDDELNQQHTVVRGGIVEQLADCGRLSVYVVSSCLCENVEYVRVYSNGGSRT